jgi:hypothetical protein
MRRIVTLVALLLFAVPLTAQQAVEHPGPEEVQVQQMEIQVPDAEVLGDVELQIQETSEMEAAPAMQPDTRNWWWLVAGIVVAGLILAVLL